MSQILLADFFRNIGDIFTDTVYLRLLGEGLLSTVIISVGAAAVGLFLGTLVAIVKIQPKASKWAIVPKAVALYTLGWVTS